MLREWRQIRNGQRKNDANGTRKASYRQREDADATCVSSLET